MSNPNPTHSALYNYDLLYEIVNHLRPRPSQFYRHVATDFTTLPTLARLARVCKSFLEPSLDALWYDHCSILPTISVFRVIENDTRSQVRSLEYDPAVTHILQS